MVLKSEWPSSESSLSTTTTSTNTRTTPVSSASNTPQKSTVKASASTSTQQQSGSATEPSARADPLDSDEKHQWASALIAEEVKSLSEAARVLNADFVAISSATHTRWRQMRDRRLQEVTSMRKKIQAAMMDWKAQLSARQGLLQTAPSVSVYNGIIEDIRGETFELMSAIDAAKEEFGEGRKQTAEDIAKLRVQFLNELQTMIESAISRFINDASASLYTQFGESSNIVPFLASTAGVASNFRSVTQCVTMMLTLMPEDIQYDVSMAQLDLFSTLAQVLPSLCPMSTKSGLPPKPNEEVGDLVGSQAIAGGDPES